MVLFLILFISTEQVCSSQGSRVKDMQYSEVKGRPGEIMSREVELGCESWTSFGASSCSSRSSTAVQGTLSLWLCPSTAVETAIAQCTSRWAMAWGHRLNTSIVLAAVHGLSGLSGGIRGRAFTLSSPSLPVPVPNKPPRFCGRKAKWSCPPHLYNEPYGFCGLWAPRLLTTYRAFKRVTPLAVMSHGQTR